MSIGLTLAGLAVAVIALLWGDNLLERASSIANPVDPSEVVTPVQSSTEEPQSGPIAKRSPADPSSKIRDRSELSSQSPKNSIGAESININEANNSQDDVLTVKPSVITETPTAILAKKFDYSPTHHKIAEMQFSSTAPVIIDAGRAIRLKVTIGISDNAKLGVDNEFSVYDQILEWSVVTDYTTCRVVKKANQRTSYVLIPGSNFDVYVEMACDRPPKINENGEINILINRKTSSGSLFVYRWNTPPFRE